MRATISASLSKRLDRVARAAQAERIRMIIPGGVIHYGTEDRIFAALAECPESRKGSYLLVPPIMTIENWEQAALETQERLVKETGEWLGPPVTSTTPDPAIVTDRYKPDPSKVQR